MLSFRRFDQQIKAESRGRLKGKWGVAFGVLLAGLLLFFLWSVVTEAWLSFTGFYSAGSLAELFGSPAALGSLLCAIVGWIVFLFFVLRPLWMGMFRWCAEVARGNYPSARTVFSYFSHDHYMPALRYSFRRLVRLTGWFFATVVLALALASGLVLSFHPQEFPQMLHAMYSGALPREDLLFSTVVTYVTFFVVGLLSFRVVTLRYFLADYLFVTEGGRGDCLRESAARMSGYKSTVWQLLVSLLGWLLLCIFIFPLLYVGPFFATCMAVTQKWILFDARKKADAGACSAVAAGQE